MIINYQRRDFLRRTFYCGLVLGLPAGVLADEAMDEAALIREMERLFHECTKGPQPDIIFASDAFMESHGQAFIDAGYAHEVVIDD